MDKGGRWFPGYKVMPHAPNGVDSFGRDYTYQEQNDWYVCSDSILGDGGDGTVPQLLPLTVAKAARSLFGTGHAESIVFFFLKAQGASKENWVRVTSSNNPPPALLTIAGMPDGFDDLVEAHLEEFSDRNNEGLPTRPGARGTTKDYALYFPIAEEPQYLLRKRDANRNAIYSNIQGGRAAVNADRAEFGDIVEMRDPPDGGAGKDIRFKDGYVYAAHWYYGPRRGVPLRIPLKPLAVWLHRTDDLPAGTDVEILVQRAVEILHITPEERYLIFDEAFEFDLPPEAYTDQWALADFFRTLCLPGGAIEVHRPTVDHKFLQLDRKTWDFMAETLGLRDVDVVMDPEQMARLLVESGKRNLLFYGPPRTSKSHFASQLAAAYLGIPENDLAGHEGFTRVQFHQGWSYGDFIRKVVPAATGGALTFERVNGAFLRHCAANPQGRSVFVIEELNRANLAHVLGEAFQVMEEGYRGRAIELPGSLPTDTIQTLAIPPDLLLIATANDIDKTTLPLDFALLSRFSTVRFPVVPRKAYEILSGRADWGPDRAERLVVLLREVEELSGYPIGHANFFSFGPPGEVRIWYESSLRPALSLFLTEYRRADLVKIDDLFSGWNAE